MEKVRINGVPESIEVKLSKEKTPVAFNKKVEELMSNGASREEAEHFVSTSVFDLELYYQKDCGLFAVDPEAVAFSDTWSPYTGEKLLPSDYIDDDVDDDEKKKIRGMLDKIDNIIEEFGHDGELILGSCIEDGEWYLAAVRKKVSQNSIEFQFHKSRSRYVKIIEINTELLKNEVSDCVEDVFGVKSLSTQDFIKYVAGIIYNEIKKKIDSISETLNEMLS